MFDLRVEVKELPIDMLVENVGQIDGVPKNPRKISSEKFKALCESIRESPEMKVLDEIKVYPFEGRYVIVGGTHRYKAYKELGWKDVLCKILPEDTPKEKLREYVIKDNMTYAENDMKLLKGWDLKELAKWDVPMNLKGGTEAELSGGEVKFTEVLGESHNYVVLYFDNEVDWLQAQTLLGIESVRLLSTKKGETNVNGKKIGIGRVLRGADVFNRLIGENIIGKKGDGNEDIG